MRCAFVLGLIAASGCGRFDFSGREADGGADTDDALSGGAFDPSGYWVVQGAHVTGSLPLARDRADPVNGLRADLTIAPDGSARLRSMHFDAGVASFPEVNAGTVTATTTQWVLSYGGYVSVFDLQPPAGVGYLLRWNADDARTVGTPPYDTVLLDRSPAPDQRVPGARTMMSLSYSNINELASGACANYGASRSRRVMGTFDISADYLVSMAFQIEDFNGVNCTGQPATNDQFVTGLLEIQDTEYRLWSFDAGNQAVSTGTFTQTGGNLELVRSTCTPATVCADLPLIVRLGP